MSPDFENMLHLFGCGALGKKADAGKCVNLRRVRELALSQNVWPIVYSALRPLTESGEVKLPPEVHAELEKVYFSNIMSNVRKVEFTRNTLKQLAEHGIECCVLKGTTLAKLYAEPDTRISSDTDMLIAHDKENKAFKVLQELGYEVKKREQHEHHFEALHPVGGLLEVHVELMQKSVSDMAFYNKIEYNEAYRAYDGEIMTFGINDGLVYNTVHFIKHFVKSGAGVRHIMDMLLYMKNFEKEIDFDKFNSLMKELRYDKLIAAAKTVGVKYWGMEFPGFEPVEDSAVEEFLSDVEDGGVFGHENSKRTHAYRIFSERRSKLSESEFRKYSVNRFGKSLFRKFFPETAYMNKIYPEVKNNQFKLFCAYFKRWYKLIKDAISGKRSVEQYVYNVTEEEKSEEALKRISLMEKLDILDRG